MAQDLVGLYNLAISAIGSRELVSLPDEESREATLCNLWYENVRNQVLRAAPWDSCRKNSLLAVLKERNFSVNWVEADPEGDYRFVYGLPADYLQPINLQSYQQFIITNYNGSRALVTNVERAILTYTSANVTISQWDNDLFVAVAYALGAAIGLNLHGKLPRAQAALQSANQMIAEARVRAANAQNVTYDHIPDWFLARGVGGTTVSRFIYASGPLLSVASVGGTA